MTQHRIFERLVRTEGFREEFRQRFELFASTLPNDMPLYVQTQTLKGMWLHPFTEFGFCFADIGEEYHQLLPIVIADLCEIAAKTICEPRLELFNQQFEEFKVAILRAASSPQRTPTIAIDGTTDRCCFPRTPFELWEGQSGFRVLVQSQLPVDISELASSTLPGDRVEHDSILRNFWWVEGRGTPRAAGQAARLYENVLDTSCELAQISGATDYMLVHSINEWNYPLEFVRFFLKSHFNENPKQGDFEKRLKIATGLLVQASNSLDRVSSVALTLRVSAVEALLCSSQGDSVAAQFARYTAALLVPNADDREQAVAALRKLYGVRSDCLHGLEPSEYDDIYLLSSKVPAKVILAVFEWQADWERTTGEMPGYKEFLTQLTHAAECGQRMVGVPDYLQLEPGVF